MKVKIFTVELWNSPGFTGDTEGQRRNAVINLRANVNHFLDNQTAASVQWLQTSAANNHGSFTQLTAIVSYEDQPTQNTSPTA